jgi:predicted RNase H-like HicB family nuclease
MKYAVVIEQAGSNYSAYVPDLPGCVAAGANIKDAENNIREAIRLHIAGMKEDGLPIPSPKSAVEYIEVAA